MSKVTLNDIASGFASIAALNANFSAIEDAIDNTLSRDGTTPNQMNADLDMNGHRILNSLVDVFGYRRISLCGIIKAIVPITIELSW